MSEQQHSVIVKYGGPVGWFSGWMFTIGFAKLGFGKAVLALVIWPYYVGSHFFQ